MLLQLLAENLSLSTVIRSNRMDTLGSGYLLSWLVFILPIIILKAVSHRYVLVGVKLSLGSVMVTVTRMVLPSVNWFCNQKGIQKGYFFCSGRINVPDRGYDPLFPSGPKMHARNIASLISSNSVVVTQEAAAVPRCSVKHLPWSPLFVNAHS